MNSRKLLEALSYIVQIPGVVGISVEGGKFYQDSDETRELAGSARKILRELYDQALEEEKQVSHL